MYNIEKNRRDEAKKAREKTLHPMPMSEPYVYLPSFSLEKRDLPEIEEWEVGEEYVLTIKVRMTTRNEQKSLMNNREYNSASFDIIGAEVAEED